MLVSKNAKICVTPNAKPQPYQWNIGCIGSPGVGACVRHVHFMLLVSILFALGGQSFQWNMGFTLFLRKTVETPVFHHFSGPHPYPAT